MQKLRPDQDLQCYFQQPSAVAALSEAGPDGFVISGCWRQQFDWAVLEWNRDNVFEHPAFRNLPDGDLSGLELTYDEVRTNCIEMDSDLFPGEWSFLRVWVEGEEQPRFVRLRDHATPIEGEYKGASAELELKGTPTALDYVGLAWLDEQYNYQLSGSDTVETAAGALADIINTFSKTVHAMRSGARIVLSCVNVGANWNRAGVYGYVSGARTEFWSPWSVQFSGGASPTKWRVHLKFSELGNAIRKIRWTYAAGWQNGAFTRSEFEVRVSNWNVTGTGREYRVAGPNSRRIESDAGEVAYTGDWTTERGNYSGASIRYTTVKGDRVTCTYLAGGMHTLYIGTRYLGNGATVSVHVDGREAIHKSLNVPLEDRLVRVSAGEYGSGWHTVTVESLGPDGAFLYFDFIEVAMPCESIPIPAADGCVSLATDWDTDHSICLAPERTANMIAMLGFRARVNHYVGAMWFYELIRKGHRYAAGSIEFTGEPQFIGGQTVVRIGRKGEPDKDTVLTHVHDIGDTAETIAKAFELEINRGCMSVRAAAEGRVLRIYSRSMGEDGNSITIACSTAGGSFTATASGATLADGTDGEWITDVQATPRLNRAARDWHRSYFAALKALDLDGVAALSMELRHGDATAEAGIAQRCPEGDPVILLTPALQTNFSPASTAFWREAYHDLAKVMAEAGAQPYLQFGEVQWWYFRDARSGMSFYDEYTKDVFRTRYGGEMATITEHTAAPEQYPEECQLLPTLIGEFTNAVMAYVRESHPECRFEVLYPLDVNESPLNRAINYPVADWTPATLDCLKTESFGYTGSRNLDKCLISIREPQQRGFAPHQSAHLVGISDPTTPWQKEVSLAKAEGVESVVLFALDQFCLIGYPVPLPTGTRRALFQGK